MPAHSKHLTHRTTLRYTDTEASILAKVVQAHADLGIKISMNDAIRVLIRRAATPRPDTEHAARALILAHWEDCTACSSDRIGCPDGWALKDMYDAVATTRKVTPP